VAVTSKTGGLKIDGLTESIKALRKLDPKYRPEAIGIIRDIAKDLQKRSQRRIGNHPQYRLPKNKGMIGRSATATGGGLKLRASKYPWAYAGEYGEVVASVFGRPVGQDTRFKRRTAAPFKPPSAGGDLSKNKGGYWIQPTIRKRFPHMMRQFDTEFIKLIDKAMRQSGVPRG